MASPQKLPDDVLAVIAAQVGSSLEDEGVGGEVGGGPGVDSPQPLGPSPGPQSGYTLAEGFEVWTFTPGMTDEYEDGNRHLSDLVRPSGIWHHQIRINGSPECFARSKPLGSTAQSWSVREVFRSPLAKDVDEAIDWIDSHVPDEVEARLLSVPFQQTEAFWFVTKPNSTLADEWNDKLLILMAPRRFSQLKPGTLVNSSTFLEAMAGPKPGEGLSRKRRSTV